MKFRKGTYTIKDAIYDYDVQSTGRIRLGLNEQGFWMRTAGAIVSPDSVNTIGRGRQ